MAYDNTPEEVKEIRIWQNVLADRTRPETDHTKARDALQRLSNEGPWAELRELKARIERIEEQLAKPASKPPTARVAGKPKKPAKPPTIKPGPVAPGPNDDLPF